jgi:muramoyltetrapeptide carboxypeptidase
MISPLIKPSPLTPGGHIAVLAASSPSLPDRINAAADSLRDAGFRVTLAANLFERENQYLAGTDDVRANLLNEAFRSDEFDAFFFARGGYGATRILDQIDYAAFRRNPRPLIGYSDVTALHCALASQTGCGSFHGPMLNTDFYEGLSPEIGAWFSAVLGGGTPEFTFDQTAVISAGAAEGVLFGGCLSLIIAMIGTPYDYWIPDGILFWEDVSEPTYRIDRMLTHLRLSGRFRQLKGVMIGRLKDCGGNDPQELDRLLDRFFGEAGVPVIRNVPFGHAGNNLLLPIGTRVHLDTMALSLRLSEPAVDLSRGRP